MNALIEIYSCTTKQNVPEVMDSEPVAPLNKRQRPKTSKMTCQNSIDAHPILAGRSQAPERVEIIKDSLNIASLATDGEGLRPLPSPPPAPQRRAQRRQSTKVEANESMEELSLWGIEDMVHQPGWRFLWLW